MGKMKNPTDAIESLKILHGASSFFCFVRLWWDGNSVDAVLWWKDGAGFHQRICYTGESWTPLDPKIVDKSISENDFVSIVSDFEALGVSEISSQSSRIAYTHYDHWFGIKRENVAEWWFNVVGGKHLDPRVAVLTEQVMKHCPSMRLAFKSK